MTSHRQRVSLGSLCDLSTKNRWARPLSPRLNPAPVLQRRAPGSAEATNPPRESPRTSTFAGPSALMNAAALAAISATEVDVSPLVLEMPALLNRITSRPPRDRQSPAGPSGPSPR
jgi:hypothetical protein